MAGDFYVLLGVDPDATSDDLRTAYRRRALDLHPDRSGTGREPFLELQEAYGVLSDPDRRAGYDRFRALSSPRRPARARFAEPLRCEHGGGERCSEVDAATSFEEVSLARSFGSCRPSLEELLERLLSNFTDRPHPKGETLQSLTVDLAITPVQAAEGGEVALSVPARVACRACAGHGTVGPYLCWRCGGGGFLSGEVPIRIAYPGGLTHDHVVRIPLEQLGIHNFFLTVRFRLTG